MHEMSICKALIEQLNDLSIDSKKIKKVYLQIGPLSGVEADLLVSAFPVASANSRAANAKLIIHNMPVVIRCQSCQLESEVALNKLICPQCGSGKTSLIAGDECLLEKIELVTEH